MAELPKDLSIDRSAKLGFFYMRNEKRKGKAPKIDGKPETLSSLRPLEKTQAIQEEK
jgi:hypothetical protein